MPCIRAAPVAGKSLVRRAESASEAAQMLKMGDEGKALAATLEAYTAAAEHGGPDEFGKTVFPVKRFAVDEPLCEHVCRPTGLASLWASAAVSWLPWRSLRNCDAIDA